MLGYDQQSIVSTSSTITSKQKHFKKRTQHIHRYQHRNGYQVRESKTTKQARWQTHGRTNNSHVRHPRRPGCSGGERSQNIPMGWKTQPFGTYRQQGKIPFNHNYGNQHRWQTGKTRRNWSKYQRQDKQLQTHQTFRAQDEKLESFYSRRRRTNN